MLIKYWDHRYSMGHMALFLYGLQENLMTHEDLFDINELKPIVIGTVGISEIVPFLQY